MKTITRYGTYALNRVFSALGIFLILTKQTNIPYTRVVTAVKKRTFCIVFYPSHKPKSLKFQSPQWIFYFPAWVEF